MIGNQMKSDIAREFTQQFDEALDFYKAIWVLVKLWSDLTIDNEEINI